MSLLSPHRGGGRNARVTSAFALRVVLARRLDKPIGELFTLSGDDS